jgi:hypothetical protein
LPALTPIEWNADAEAAFQKAHQLFAAREGWEVHAESAGQNVQRVRRFAEWERLLSESPEEVSPAQMLAMAEMHLKQGGVIGRSAQFHADALGNPECSEELKQKHRYNAACATLRYASQPIEISQLGADRRRRWRTQSLQWLSEELEHRAKLIEQNDGNETELEERFQLLRFWKRVSDPASVGQAAFENLDPDEREGWKLLWAEWSQLVPAQ